MWQGIGPVRFQIVIYWAGIINRYLMEYFPRFSPWIFTAGFLTLALIYRYDEILFELPQSIHQWRQADCLSLTTNYYEDKNPFLRPSVHYLGQDGTGKTISEFPIIYYLVAKIWTITGRNIWVYRLLMALIFFGGLFAIFRTIEQELEHSFAGIFTGLLLFSSPVLVYYGSNFLMNIAAFSLAGVGLYFFFSYRRNPKTTPFIWFCFFYTLAALLKVSSLLSFIAIFLIYLLERLKMLTFEKRIFPVKGYHIPLFVLVLIIPFLWYRYAVYYNSHHTGGIFLIGTLPAWKMTADQISATWNHIIYHLRWDYFRPAIEIFMAILGLITIFYYRKTERSVLTLLVLTGLGSAAFCLLFFGALQWHDYYVIDLYIMVPLLFLAFFQVFRAKLPKAFHSLLMPVMLLVILIHSADFARRRMVERYDINGYRNQHHREIFQAFSELEPTLQELGIRRDEKVLSLSDYSINITLYLMDRKGWTDYGIQMNPEIIDQKIREGAGYLLIADPKTYENEDLNPYLQEKIGSYRNIDIYTLKNLNPGQQQ
jgi:hypothetical protein